MDFKEISKKKKDDLKTLLGEKRKALQEFRFNLAGSKLKNLREGRNLRKDIARILTASNSKSE